MPPSDQARYTRPIDSGTIAKLVHNCAGYAINTAMAEVMTPGIKGGLETLKLTANPARRNRSAPGHRLLAGNFCESKYRPPNFMLKMAHKFGIREHVSLHQGDGAYAGLHRVYRRRSATKNFARRRSRSPHRYGDHRQ